MSERRPITHIHCVEAAALAALYGHTPESAQAVLRRIRAVCERQPAAVAVREALHALRIAGFGTCDVSEYEMPACETRWLLIVPRGVRPTDMEASALVEHLIADNCTACAEEAHRALAYQRERERREGLQE